jgi:hypothetical protein
MTYTCARSLWQQVGALPQEEGLASDPNSFPHTQVSTVLLVYRAFSDQRDLEFHIGCCSQINLMSLCASTDSTKQPHVKEVTGLGFERFMNPVNVGLEQFCKNRILTLT